MVRLILKLNALLWCNFHYTVKNEILPFSYKMIPTLSLPRFEEFDDIILMAVFGYIVGKWF
jgi:hypothetical protein